MICETRAKRRVAYVHEQTTDLPTSTAQVGHPEKEVKLAKKLLPVSQARF